MISSLKISKHSSTAFAPGHISGFFQPIYHENNMLMTGSRGAGFSVTHGCQTIVTLKKEKKQRISIFSDKKQIHVPVIMKALKHLVGDAPLHIKVSTNVQLPIGQGFGMSAASCLAAAFATADCLNISLKKALTAAHQAEVESQSGLGDVIAAFSGGIEIRRHPGIFRDDIIYQIPGASSVVLCVIDSPVDTKKVLTDRKKAEYISLIGKKCTDDLLKNPTIENFFSLSLYFTKKTGLASDKIISILDKVNSSDLASMCMLGNSIFAMGKKERLIKILEPYGKIVLTTVDERGARVIS
jgi:pantoate kinase